jgi:hypothetical protein
MKPADANKLLALVARRAKELRDAGVLRVELPELRLELAPADYTPRADTAEHAGGSVRTVDIGDDSDPFNDPTTFAMRDGSVPGFKARRRTETAD